MHNNYLEIVLDNKIYYQRTPNSKFTEFTLDGIKLNTYDQLPKEIKDIAEEMIASEENPNDYFEYRIIEDEVLITKITALSATHIKIPTTINGFPVTGLDNSIIPMGATIEQIQIPESVTFFNEACFSDAINLRFVNIPANITKIPDFCFHSCYNISGVDFSNITEIGEYAFKNCHSFINIDLSSVEKIGAHAFDSCSFLKKIKFSPNLKIINNGTFKCCSGLEKLKLPENLEKLEVSSFEDCFALCEINFPENLKTIGHFCFHRSGLTDIILPNKLNYIGEFAFGRTSLKSIEINSKIKIEDSALIDCKNIKEIILADKSFYPKSLDIIHLNKVKVLTDEGDYISFNTEKRGEER